MKCTACRRQIATPALTLAGMVFGPVCAKRVLFDAEKLIEPQGIKRTEVVRDALTGDLFNH